MSPDIRQTLHDAARSPGLPVDPDDLRARGGRRRTGQLVGGAAMALVIGMAGVQALTSNRPVKGPPVITDVTPGPSDPSPSPTSGPIGDVHVVSSADLGRSVATAPGGNPDAIVRHPDGSTSNLEISTGPAGRWYPDADGGIWWQDVCSGGPTVTCASGSSAINHTVPDGTSREVIPASQTFSVSQDWKLVGPGLATRRTGEGINGTNEDLLSVALDGQSEVLRASVGGWESSLGEAVASESVLYSFRAEGFSMAILSPPTGKNVTVYEGGEVNGEYVEGVGHAAGGMGVVLVTTPVGFPDWPTARLLLVDAEGRPTGEVDVPVDLGTSTWNVPRRISVQDDVVLVNRYAEGTNRYAEGTWIEALVLDLDTGNWSVYDQPGLSKFVSSFDDANRPPPSPAACATEDGEQLRRAPEGRYWLYWGCVGVLYRVEEYFQPDFGPSGGVTVATALKRHLEAMIAGPSDASGQRGYFGPDKLNVTINAVEEMDATVHVDFSAPDGFASFSTSAGSALWHALLASIAFQYDLDVIAFSLDGSCEDYSFAFEGDGACVGLTPDTAPWNQPKSPDGN